MSETLKFDTASRSGPWPIKSGSLRFRPEPLEDDAAALKIALTDVYESVHQSDLAIEYYAYALEIIQPTDAPGKISVRYLKRAWGGVPGRHPHFVQWYRSRNGRWLYHRLKATEVIRKVPRYAVFEPIKHDVKLLLRETIGLIERREAAVAMLSKMRTQARSIGVSTGRLNAGKKDQILDWLPLLKEKRERLIAESRRAVALADAALPADAAPSSESAPRVSRTGSVRGRLNQTVRRSR
jgi:hypothetical protein